MTKRQICFTIDEEYIKEMEEIRDETGLPVSRQIEMKLNGYEIVKEGIKMIIVTYLECKR